jgi:hypothetical protein
MLQYGAQVLKLYKFVSKIGYANTASAALFRRLGFECVSRSDIFEEETLELSGPAVQTTWTPMDISSYARFAES